MMNFAELASVPSERAAPFTDQLRLAVAAHLACHAFPVMVRLAVARPAYPRIASLEVNILVCRGSRVRASIGTRSLQTSPRSERISCRLGLQTRQRSQSVAGALVADARRAPFGAATQVVS
jgi:hypothetical protein